MVAGVPPDLSELYFLPLNQYCISQYDYLVISPHITPTMGAQIVNFIQEKIVSLHALQPLA